MFRSPPPALALLLCATLLTACASPPPALVRHQVPASLLVCQAQPQPPEPGTDDTALALWIVDLAAAGDDCRGRLARVKGLVTP